MPLCGEDHAKLIARINRIQGQVGGLKKMVDENRDCMQVLKQIAATTGALRSLGAILLEDHSALIRWPGPFYTHNGHNLRFFCPTPSGERMKMKNAWGMGQRA